MTEAVEFECSQHPNRFECPDALVDYSPRFDEYGLIVHDGASSTLGIAFCPWCGTALPASRRDQWFDELKRHGFEDPLAQDIPERFDSDAWWRQEARGALVRYECLRRSPVGKA